MTIPSPKESVAAELSTLLTQETVPVEKVITATEIKSEVEKAAETVKETKAEVPSLTTANSDEAAEKPADTEVPREGEKPGQFIKRLKEEKAQAIRELAQERENNSKNKGAQPEEIKKLREEIESRERTIEAAKFERSQKYQERFAKPIQKVSDGTKELIGKFTETKGVFERAMALDVKERADYLVETIGESAAALVLGKLDRIDELSKDRDAALSDHAQLRQANLEASEKNETAQILNQFDGLKDQMSKSLSVFRGEHAEQIIGEARSLLTGEASAQAILTGAYLAAACPHYIAEVKSLRAENATLKARVAEDNAGDGRISGRGTDTAKSKDAVHVNGSVPSIRDVIRAQVRELS